MISKVCCNKQPFEILPDIFLLGDNRFFYLYLIRGKNKVALIELGVSLIVDEVINQIIEIEIEPDFLVLTHPHSDHITGWNKLHQKYPEALLITGEKVCKIVNSTKINKIISHEDQYLYEQLLRTNDFFKGHPIKKLIDFKESIIVTNDSKIDLGGLSIKCIPVGGHSVGNIIVEVPERKALFVSDSLGYQINNKHIPMFLTGLSDYLQTIEKIMDLKANLIAPAHYGPFLGDEAIKLVQSVKHKTITFYKEISKNKNMLVENVFDYMNNGILSKISKKSMMHCAKLLIENVKKWDNLKV